MAITLKKFDPHAGPIKPFDCRVDLLNDFLLEEDANIPNARHHALELLAGDPDILPRHLSEAASYRFLDRRNILDL